MYDDILDKIGSTPLAKIQLPDEMNVNLYAKLEFYNPTGSVKDRAANYIISKLLNNHEIDKDTIIIESSSGNFGIALSTYCKKYGLKFICVIDKHTLPVNEKIIRSLSYDVEKITELDNNGGYLLNRIKRVKELHAKYPNSYWVNQYANPYNAEVYYNTLGKEICDEVEDIDYVFMGVSSGGTITGVSQKVKERYPNAKVIAVDIDGSVIFGGQPKKRYIPGIGSGMVPEILKQAKIDDVMVINEVETIESCHDLLKNHSIFAGGSSGSVFIAVKKYFQTHRPLEKQNVVVVFPDRGDRYASTIYNDDWCNDFISKCSIYKRVLDTK